MTMDRRRFLRGLGGITVGLPMLSMFAPRGRSAAQGGAPRPTRMIVMAYPMGTYVPYWRPSGTGSSFTLGPIADALTEFQDRCLWISNCDNAVHQLVNAHRFGHPGKEATTLTGTLTLDALSGGRNDIDSVNAGGGAELGAAGPSIEETVGRYLRTSRHTRPAIGLAVNGRPDRTRDVVNSQFFYESAGNPATLQANVGRAFTDLFADFVDPGAPVDPAVEYLHERNRSVLDAVRASFVDLRQGLGTEDRRVLDEHADKIRFLERDVMRAMCAPPDAIGGSTGGTSMSQLARLQNRIVAAAMGCDFAPAARIEYIEQQNPFFGIPVVDDQVAGSGEDWHALVHLTDDTSPGRIAGYRFFVEMYAHLLSELEATPDAGGASVLDNSLVMLATNFGPGNGHSAKKMHTLLAGNLGGARRGYHYDAAPGAGFYTDSSSHMNHVHNSILQMVGVTQADGSPLTTHGLRGFADAQVVSELFT